MAATRNSVVLPAAVSFLLWALVTGSYAATINSSSCSQADVGMAVAASSPRDTIVVPSGNCTWNTKLRIAHGLTLQGAGVGNTTITANNGDNFILEYAPSAPQNDVLYRVTGFTFNMNSTHSILHLVMQDPVEQHNIRIDHNAFTNTRYGHSVFWFEGPFYGVTDHNDFQGDPYIENYGCPDGQNNWQQITFDPGSNKSMYFEDNTFTEGQTLFSTGNGGRFVFRYNTVTLTADGWPLLDAHGNMGSGGNYGTMGIEIYGNLIIGNNHDFILSDHRGGKGRVFNNRATSAGTESFVKMREEHTDTLNPPANNLLDGTPQHVNDAYYWQNRDRSNTLSVKDFSENTGTTRITENVDFFFHNPSFNGTAGVGVGTLAQMQAITPTVTGVGFWVTNDSPTTLPTTLPGLKSLSGTLYRWSGNAWVLFYTPYQYPHPLTALTGPGDVTPPASPTNLRIQ